VKLQGHHIVIVTLKFYYEISREKLQGLDTMKVIKASAMVTLSQIFLGNLLVNVQDLYIVNVMMLALRCCQYTFIMNLVSNLQVFTVRCNNASLDGVSM